MSDQDQNGQVGNGQGQGDQSAETAQVEATTILVICGANESQAQSGETINEVAERLKDELNIPPTFDPFVSFYDQNDTRHDEVMEDHDYVLEDKDFELEFVKPGHTKG